MIAVPKSSINSGDSMGRVLAAGHHADRQHSRASEDTNLPEEADLIVKQVLLHDLAVLPVRDGAELQLERLAGGASCSLPSNPFQGPIILPCHRAMVQVQSPEPNITRYGLLSR